MAEYQGGKVAIVTNKLKILQLFLEVIQIGPISSSKGNNICELPVCQHSCIIFQWTQPFLLSVIGTLFLFLVSGL